MKRILTLLMLFSWVLPFCAQENSREKSAKGSYTYEIPKSMSYEQACQAALIKAQNDAIAEAFGLSVGEENTIFISNIDGKSNTSFHSATQGSVRGVWLADEKAPEFEKFLQDGRDWVKVTVKGKVREIVNAGIDFEVAPIRYKADKELATDVFKNGDDFFLYFKSPVDGFLTVFLFDITAGEAFCLLPYQDSGKGAYPIKFNEEYYFIILDHDPDVLDIREQFWLQLSETLEIASRLNIRHPRQGNFPSPISTDFVITRRDGIYARTVKESRELEDPRILEKFSIEFQYWKEKGIDWKVVTEKEINRDLARNLQWLHSGPSVTEIIPDAGLREEACALLLELFAERQFSFSGMLEIAEEGLGLPPGAAITLFKNLVLTGRVSLDLNQPMDFMDPFAKED